MNNTIPTACIYNIQEQTILISNAEEITDNLLFQFNFN